MLQRGVIWQLLMVLVLSSGVGCVAPSPNQSDAERHRLGTTTEVNPPESRLLGLDERSREIERNVGVR